MPTDCSPTLFEFAPVENHAVVASFDGGRITSDAGALLLGATDRVIGLTRRFAACFKDSRNGDFVEHSVQTLVTQRIVGIALGYEDLIDHDELRHDPVMAVLAGKLAATRSDCAPLAGKSTLNRLELSRRSRLVTPKSPPTQTPLRLCWSICSSTRTPRHRARSCSIWMLRTILCTVTRKVASSMAITTPTAICRFTCFADGICWRPSCGAPTSTLLRVRSVSVAATPHGV